MPFYQNPFFDTFDATWVLSDRQYNTTFRIPINSGRGSDFVVSHADGPFNMSGNDADGDSTAVLNIVFALNDKKNWTDLAVTITGTSSSAITVSEVVSSLNNTTLFADFFTAEIQTLDNGVSRVRIRQKKPISTFWFYIKNNQAETLLKFNKFAGVGELPSFFARHTIANRFTYTDSQNHIVELAPSTSNVDAAVINNAVNAYGKNLGYSSSSVKEDYELLAGRSGLFTFRVNTIDGSNRITETIEYPAGAVAGDMAKKIEHTYTGANTNPDQTTEIPYVLQSGDLITP